MTIEEGLQRGGGIFVRPARELESTSAGLLNKFNSLMVDALKKLERQERGSLIVFINLIGFDFPTSKRKALAERAEWARRTEQRTGAKVVVCYNGAWQSPFYLSS